MNSSVNMRKSQEIVMETCLTPQKFRKKKFKIKILQSIESVQQVHAKKSCFFKSRKPKLSAISLKLKFKD